LGEGAAQLEYRLKIGAAAIAIISVRSQFLEVVTGAERRTVGRKYDRANRAVVAYCSECFSKRFEQALGERISRLGPIQHEQRDTVVVLA
jgi:hypothetical protein